MPKKSSINKPFLWTVIILVLFGFMVFYSASTGLAAREGLGFYGKIVNQLLVGVVGGFSMMFVLSKINHQIIKKYGLLIFIIALLTTFAVFIPGLGIESGGATRWLRLGALSLQPSEILKVATIIFIAAWFNIKQKSIRKPYFALISIISTILIISVPLILQRDFDVIFLIALPLIGMYLVSKAPLKTGIIAGLIVAILGATVAFSVPHIKNRITGFINPNEGGQTVNYQYRQSQIAIGSGGLFGKGFGQSTQKFGSLPEPTNDSIFAVLAEEFGLFGSTVLLILYFIFGVIGYKIAINAKTMFGSLFTFGIITLVLVQSFMNIASMVGLFPITGQPLVFISHGGTSLLVTLSMMGIILNISKRGK
jgi:cell division protein FtsW